jgi:hypothetical protein
MLDVLYERVEHVSWLVCTRRRELRSPWRKLSCFKQALLTLAHLQKDETFAQVDTSFRGIGGDGMALRRRDA